MRLKRVSPRRAFWALASLACMGILIGALWRITPLREVDAAGPEPLATLACSVEGIVDLQRRYAQGHPSWNTQVRVSVRPAGQAGPVEQSTVWSDAQGVFYFYVTEPGLYDIGVKSAHALESRASGVTLQQGFTPGLHLGTLLEGDADDSNAINTLDFDLLRAAFWSPNVATDFNVDGTTNVLDYSLLYTNYGLTGPRPAALQGRGALPHEARLRGAFRLEVDSLTVAPGAIFELPIRVFLGGGSLDAVEARLSFDPTRLRVVDVGGMDSDTLLPGPALTTVLRNVANNTTGTIRYAAGSPLGGAAASTDFVLATIRFQAAATLGDAVIGLEEALIGRRGVEQALSLNGGTVQVRMPDATQTPTPTPTATASRTPTATASRTPTATQTASSAPTEAPTATETGEPSVTLTPTATDTPATSQLWLPLLRKQQQAPETSRFGVNVLGRITDYDLQQLGPVGWYQNWSFAVAPPRPGGVQYAQLIRLRDADPAYWPPDWETLASAIQANPGALWFIGNEPDVASQDNCTPQVYAERYHACYTFIKARDATAQVSAAGIVQPTALRLRWLDQALDAYAASYGMPMPVDVWNIHLQILPERKDGWGCQIPPGLPDEIGEDRQVSDNVSVALFEEKVRAFRHWMEARGERHKPLIISEYGVLMPSGYGYLGGRDVALGDQMVKDFMTGTFDFCLAATDPALGYPADQNRLVQQWAWYSLNDRMADFNITPPYLGFNGSLFEWTRSYPGTLTQFGRHFRDYLATIR